MIFTMIEGRCLSHIIAVDVSLPFKCNPLLFIECRMITDYVVVRPPSAILSHIYFPWSVHHLRLLLYYLPNAFMLSLELIVLFDLLLPWSSCSSGSLVSSSFATLQLNILRRNAIHVLSLIARLLCVQVCKGRVVEETSHLVCYSRGFLQLRLASAIGYKLLAWDQLWLAYLLFWPLKAVRELRYVCCGCQ